MSITPEQEAYLEDLYKRGRLSFYYTNEVFDQLLELGLVMIEPNCMCYLSRAGLVFLIEKYKNEANRLLESGQEARC